jgi:hypothetical protein
MGAPRPLVPFLKWRRRGIRAAQYVGSLDDGLSVGHGHPTIRRLGQHERVIVGIRLDEPVDSKRTLLAGTVGLNLPHRALPTARDAFVFSMRIVFL